MIMTVSTQQFEAWSCLVKLRYKYGCVVCSLGSLLWEPFGFCSKVT